MNAGRSRKLSQAVHAGKLSVRLADQLLYLPIAEQKTELERRLSEARACETRNRAVAGVIRKYLDTLHGRQPDLLELSGIIRQALS